MIIRIRTNVGASKLNVDPTSTFSEFRELVMRTLHIEGPEINLAFDLSGEKLIVPNGKSLSELGIYQGSELFVIGKFEKRIVEKSYINDQGEVVPAGQTLVRVDSKCQADVATANEQKEQLDYTQQQAQQLNQGLIESSAAEAESEAMKGDSDSLAGAPTDAADIPFDYNAYKDVLDYEEMNGVRAPDEAKKMTLLGEPAGAEYDIGATEAGRSLMLAVLSAEEHGQIADLERSLREAGLREYEVLQETQNLQDELIASRLQRESAMDTRTMAAVDVLRHCSRAADSLQGSVREVDGSLARYHAAQRAPQPSVLRLQQYQQQQGARAAVPSIRKTTQSTALPAAKSKSAPSTTAAAAAQVESATTRTNKKGAEGSGKGPVPGNITERSASQHSDITQSSASSVNNVNPKSAGSSGKSSVKSRQPSKAYTAAMRELEDITQEAGALASATGGRLSALQQGALRTLSAPVPAVGPAAATPTAAIRAVTRPPAPAMHVSTIAAAARNNGVSQQGNDVHDSAVPLINALSPTSTLSRSVNSPTRGFQSTQQQPASSAFAPYPVGQQQHEQHQQQHEMGIRDYDIDEDALLALLSEEVQPSLNRSTRGEAAASSPAQAQKKVSDNDHNSTGKVRAGSESSTSNNPGARPRKLERPASAAAVRKVVTPASTEIPKPAPSLMDSGYKTMAQIKAENERSDHQINKRIGLSVKATSMPNVKTPTASHAKLSSSRTHGHDDGVAAAADEAVYMDEGMDDSLALALQLSLEDSQQRQQQQQQLHSTSKQLPASKVRTNGRAKKVTVVAPQPDRVAPPSTLLPSSRRPIPVLLPPTRHIPSHRVSSQDSVIGGSVATGVAAGSVTARRERESAAAHNRLAQERLQQQQQELRRLQEQLDAETAAALMREEQEQEEADFAAAHEYQHNMNRAEETALLRQHLHGGAGDEFGGPPLRRGGGGGVKPAGALPGWLHRTVDDFTNDALFDLAAQRSLQHDLGQHQQAFYQPQSVLPQRHLAGGRPQRPYIDQPRADAAIAAAVSRGPLHGTYNMGDANYMNVEYDEDDEILARAIQNSLNEEAY